MNKILDKHTRPLQDLRVSVTDRCNFRCTYCMPEEIFHHDYPYLTKDRLLSFTEISLLIDIFAELGVKKVRITGGEPLLRKNLTDLIAMISAKSMIEDVAMTTNGSLLSKYAQDLKSAGLHRVTVSLDSLDEHTFRKLNGEKCDVSTVLRGIEAAREAGLSVKVNMLVKRGVNDHDILPMAKYFKDRAITLRFIEYMDVGTTNDWELKHVVPSMHILKQLESHWDLEAMEADYFGEVAKRYRYRNSNIEIGFISSVTQAFCSTCTRARLSAEGALYTCLFASEGYDLRSLLRDGESYASVRQKITSLWSQRDDNYSEERLNQINHSRRKKVEMSHIGG